MAKKLLLFDIDGTLLESGGAGMASLAQGFAAAFPEVADQPFPNLDLGGATDGGVSQFLFSHFEMEDSPEQRERFYLGYLDTLPRQIAHFRAAGEGFVLPGITDLLSGLQEREDEFILGLLTGNLRRGAEVKLRSYELDHFFSFDDGSYGDDHDDRNELGPIALERVRQTYGVPIDQAIVIGDTSRDVDCARAAGFPVIATATGHASYDALAETDPDYLLHDLSDTEMVLSLLDEV